MTWPDDEPRAGGCNVPTTQKWGAERGVTRFLWTLLLCCSSCLSDTLSDLLESLRGMEISTRKYATCFQREKMRCFLSSTWVYTHQFIQRRGDKTLNLLTKTRVIYLSILFALTGPLQYLIYLTYCIYWSTISWSNFICPHISMLHCTIIYFIYLFI